MEDQAVCWTNAVEELTDLTMSPLSLQRYRKTFWSRRVNVRILGRIVFSGGSIFVYMGMKLLDLRFFGVKIKKIGNIVGVK